MNYKRKGGWLEVILKYLGAVCVYCGAKEKLHVHHVIPLSRGGANEMANLEVVCIPCHNKIHRVWDTMPRKKSPRGVIIDCGVCGFPFDTNGKQRKNCENCRPKRNYD